MWSKVSGNFEIGGGEGSAGFWEIWNYSSDVSGKSGIKIERGGGGFLSWIKDSGFSWNFGSHPSRA